MQDVIINAVVTALRKGQTILYPTDTIWGIGCDAGNAEAVERIYAIKERDHGKSMLVLVSEAMLSADLPEAARELLLRSGRPTTVVLPAGLVAAPLAGNLPAADGTVGVRVPRFGFCQRMLCGLGRPVVSTSANLSGRPSPARYEDIEKEVRQRVDYVLPDDESFHHPDVGSSRIVKLLLDGSIVTLRG